MRIILQYLIIFVCVSLMLIGCASITLDTYKPKSTDEEAIIKVLKKNRECLQNMDLQGLLATFHDNASIMIYQSNEGRPMVSKKRFAEYVPSSAIWGEPWKIAGVTITISGDTATIKAKHIVEGYSSINTIVMEKENGSWLITNWSFGRYS